MFQISVVVQASLRKLSHFGLADAMVAALTGLRCIPSEKCLPKEAVLRLKCSGPPPVHAIAHTALECKNLRTVDTYAVYHVDLPMHLAELTLRASH